MYYDNNKHKECFLATYEAVKDSIGKYYDTEPLTLKQMCQILAPMCRAVIRDHVDGINDISEDDKEKAFKESIEFMLKLIKGKDIDEQ